MPVIFFRASQSEAEQKNSGNDVFSLLPDTPTVAEEEDPLKIPRLMFYEQNFSFTTLISKFRFKFMIYQQDINLKRAP